MQFNSKIFILIKLTSLKSFRKLLQQTKLAKGEKYSVRFNKNAVFAEIIFIIIN